MLASLSQRGHFLPFWSRINCFYHYLKAKIEIFSQTFISGLIQVSNMIYKYFITSLLTVFFSLAKSLVLSAFCVQCSWITVSMLLCHTKMLNNTSQTRNILVCYCVSVWQCHRATSSSFYSIMLQTQTCSLFCTELAEKKSHAACWWPHSLSETTLQCTVVQQVG